MSKVWDAIKQVERARQSAEESKDTTDPQAQDSQTDGYLACLRVRCTERVMPRVRVARQ